MLSRETVKPEATVMANFVGQEKVGARDRLFTFSLLLTRCNSGAVLNALENRRVRPGVAS